MKPLTHGWHVRVLGGVAIERSTENVYAGDRLAMLLQNRQAMRVIALLAAAGRRGLLRTELLCLLWTEGDGQQAHDELTRLIYWTRRVLGRGAIEGRDYLRLNEQIVSTDVAEFLRAIESGRPEDAVGIYSGPLFGEEVFSDTPALERWVEAERARLEQGYRDALRALDVRRTGNGTAQLETPRSTWSWRKARIPLTASSLLLFVLGVVIVRRGERHPSILPRLAFANQQRDSSPERICRASTAFIIQGTLERLEHDSLVIVIRADSQLNQDSVSAACSARRRPARR